MSIYLAVFRWREVYAPGNWVGKPYWQARSDVYITASREDAEMHCNAFAHGSNLKGKIYFENPEVPSDSLRDQDGSFDSHDHWRIFEFVPGTSVNVSQ